MSEALFYISGAFFFLSACGAAITIFFLGKVKGMKECKKIYETALQNNLQENLEKHMREAFTDMGMVEIPQDQIPEAVRKRIEEVRGRNTPTKH